MPIVTAARRKSCYRPPKLDLGGLPTPARDFFRENLQRRMDELNLSLSALGRRVGVSPSTVKRWLDGERYPSLETLEVLAPALGLSVSQLLDDPKRKFTEKPVPMTVTVEDAMRIIKDALKTDKKGRTKDS